MFSMGSTLRQLAPFIIAIFVVGYWYYDRKQTKLHNQTIEEEADTEDAPSGNGTATRRASPSGSSASAPSANGTPTETAPVQGGAPVAATEEAMHERFVTSMKDMSTCLELPTSGAPAESNINSWITSMKGSLGEPVLQTEDSSAVDIQTSSGERRRIQVEMDYSGEDRIVRRVKYVKLNGDEPGEAIPLAKEQSEDPSETFLASLESDGQVTGREKNERVYFASGEEVVVTEKNGKVSNIEVNRNGRSFRCQPTDVNAPKCECVE